MTCWELLTHLAVLDCLVDDWVKILDNHLSLTYNINFKLEVPEEAKMLHVTEEYTRENSDGSTTLFLPAQSKTSKELAMLFMSGIEEIIFILPYHRFDYKPNIRLLADVILMDAKNKRATDIHFVCESNLDNNFNYTVKFRQGIYLVAQSKYNVSKTLIEEIIHELLRSRSSVGHKAADLGIQSALRFRLIDDMFPSRCQVGNSIGGLTLTVRSFDFGRAPRIHELGFNKETQDMLYRTSKMTNGLTLVSGVFGSGKGTTLNAVGMEMEEQGRLAIASLDDPIEYLRKYNQFEYHNEAQMEEYVDSFKKMDLNVVFLNEVITGNVAQNVFNLVAAGVHVLTTIHVHRVYKVMYKLEEMLGSKYLNIIPFLNTISYQDKFSICCPNCTQGIAKENYKDNLDALALLNFLGLDTIRQPSGCSLCTNGVMQTGIKVVSEHITFNDEMKSKMLQMNIHQQFNYLKEINDQNVPLESVIKDALVKGEILIEEALVKLDTWR